MENERGMIRTAGASLVISAVGFVVVFSILAGQFDYPDILDEPASQFLPALLDGGTSLHLTWWVYSLLPLLLLPAAAGAFQALRNDAEGMMRVASYFAVLAALTLTLGLIRWPSLNLELAERYATGTADQRAAIEIMVAATNRYLGTYIGEHLGELFLNGWFVMSGTAMLRSTRFPKWVAWAGICVGVLGLVGMFRFASSVVEPISAANNFLLPAWLITYGIALWTRGPMTTENAHLQ